MKFITPLVAIAALTVAFSTLRAQEESASPLEDIRDKVVTPPADASAPESSPAAMPEEKPTPALPASTPTKKETAPSASPAATGAAEKKAASSASTTTAAAKAPAKKTEPEADTGSAESNVKRLESEWEAAVMKHDLAFAQARLADDFIGTSSRGKRLTKASLMKEMKADSDTYTSAKNGSITVQSFGPNVAVATGTSKEVGKAKDGKAFSRTYAWTDTWMLRGKKWQCIGSQAMLVSGK